MKLMVIILAILLSFSVALGVGCATETTTDDSESSQEETEGEDTEEADDHGEEGEIEPSLTVTSPTEGQTISGSTVSVSWEVEGVELVPGGQGANDHDEGHIHVTLDEDGSPTMTPSDSAELTDVPAGSHTVTVELVENNHRPKSPEVKETISFTVE
ncbi:MAG: hypothetical protein ACE5E0_00770 [Terriglobia bacterium]